MDLNGQQYRWDQRLIALIVACSPSDRCPDSIKSLCEATGGWHCVSSHLQSLMSNVENMLSKLQTFGPMVSLSAYPENDERKVF